MSTVRRILVGDSHASGLAAAAARAGVPFVASQAFSGQRTSTDSRRWPYQVCDNDDVQEEEAA